MLPDYQMERQSPDKKLFVSADTNVPLHKRFVFVDAAATVTLPNVSEAEGRKFVVNAQTSAGVTVVYGNGLASNASTSISSTDVAVEFESDGLDWIVSRT